MNVSVAEAKNRLPEMIPGERVIITRHGKPVAQISRHPGSAGKPGWGGMKDRIKLPDGWDAPVDLDRFLAGDQ